MRKIHVLIFIVVSVALPSTGQDINYSDPFSPAHEYWTRELNDPFTRLIADFESGKRELDESLRSLGLRPSRDRVRQGTTQSDGATGLRDSGTRTAPPAAYQELFDAFKKGAARSTR